MSFLKKAMGVFVEFEEDPISPSTRHTSSSPQMNMPNIQNISLHKNPEELQKFDQHFSNLFDKANLPGPDYYEFWKTMQTLEAHIVDEKARMAATYASLAIQGLTKEKLISSATQYTIMLQADRAEFEKAAKTKELSDVDGRKVMVVEHENKIKKNSEMIQALTKEITESQVQITTLKTDIDAAEQKIVNNQQHYLVAQSAMLNQIESDITKIKTNL
jgi:uncharacterized protein with von Willebrand factor type A (vWA) domain